MPNRREVNGCAFVQFRCINAATHALHALNARKIPETGRLLKLEFSSTRQTRSEPERQSLASRDPVPSRLSPPMLTIHPTQ
ncbi:hypothetical protein PISMIDRAFT_685205 [Pisolithus microcarpus 441]|uniref:RRM domain-containing protein n=1 Tax=Pisolithus microcarpus 441 TaxID=765257 RepID=A0A0C9Z584_9AGAM|nr:hypothetical protein BKA83DRAFT_688748 [Pisolithus microcarpus]KIK17597.1 hypothetical protein PISMIDRAFT_685205 [Pisolithus microcarpus 441]